MRTFPLCAAVLAIAAMAAAAPQASTPPKRPATTPASRTSTARPKLTDAQLETLIKSKFAKSKIHEDKFTVRVQGGVAHIEGRTDVIQHKGVATRMARTAGAVVDNRIEVSQAAKDKAAGNLEEGRRRVQVKRGDVRSDARPAK
jgi:hypothetical protein